MEISKKICLVLVLFVISWYSGLSQSQSPEQITLNYLVDSILNDTELLLEIDDLGQVEVFYSKFTDTLNFELLNNYDCKILFEKEGIKSSEFKRMDSEREILYNESGSFLSIYEFSDLKNKYSFYLKVYDAIQIEGEDFYVVPVWESSNMYYSACYLFIVYSSNNVILKILKSCYVI